MSDLATLLPPRRLDLIVRPLGDGGRWVIKDPASGHYYELGAAEHFLLERLDGRQDAADVRAAYAERSPWLVYLPNEPRLLHLRGNPRFEEFLGRTRRALHLDLPE